MRQIRVFLLLIILTSCEYFNVKKISSEAILKEELQTFKWNEVDEYPTFSFCDSSASKIERKYCFENTLVNGITSQIQKEHIVVTQDINDTVIIKFQVSEIGNLSVLTIEADSITKQEIPNIEELLLKSLDSLPKIFPALKRSQQVTTEFTLPIIISVN